MPVKLAAALILVLAGAAFGDRIHLTNGNTLEGEYRDLGDGEVEIVSALGSLRIPSRMVERVERQATVEERVAARLEELAADDAEGRFELARWASAQGAETLARDLYRQVLAIDPDHELARRALGFVFHDGRWLTEREFRAARGDVLYRGEWMSPGERDRTREASDRLIEEMRRQVDEMRRVQLEAEVRRLQAEVDRQASFPPSPYSGFSTFVGGFFPPVIVHPPIHHLPFPRHPVLPVPPKRLPGPPPAVAPTPPQRQTRPQPPPARSNSGTFAPPAPTRRIRHP